MDKKSIQADLKHSVAEVVFTKDDGTIRTMKATLSAQYLPKMTEEYVPGQPDPETYVAGDPNLVAVWDIEANGWRSFKINKVISMQRLDNF